MAEEAFGSRFLDELKRRADMSVITAQLNYAQIQRIRAADREELVRLFHGSGYAMIQHVKQDSAEELAQWMLLNASLRTSRALMLFGITVS